MSEEKITQVQVIGFEDKENRFSTNGITTIALTEPNETKNRFQLPSQQVGSTI